MEFRFTDPSNLKAIRTALGQSLREFGRTLKKAVDPSDTIGYSNSYIIQLEDGRRNCTPELERGYRRIAAAFDETDPDLATAKAVTVYATSDIGGALVMGEARQCARPGCPVKFVPTSNFQKYHNRRCRDLNAAQHQKGAGPARPPSGGPFLGSVQWEPKPPADDHA